jgi:hypothetical protein
MMKKVMALAMAGGIALGFGACSSDKSQVQDEIKKQLKDKAGVDSTVTCPDNVSAKKGNSFTCDVTANGSTVKFLITFTDDTHFNIDLASDQSTDSATDSSSSDSSSS